MLGRLFLATICYLISELSTTGMFSCARVSKIMTRFRRSIDGTTSCVAETLLKQLAAESTDLKGIF
jgi:hypothetical protein